METSIVPDVWEDREPPSAQAFIEGFVQGIGLGELLMIPEVNHMIMFWMGLGITEKGTLYSDHGDHVRSQYFLDMVNKLKISLVERNRILQRGLLCTHTIGGRVHSTRESKLGVPSTITWDMLLYDDDSIREVSPENMNTAVHIIACAAVIYLLRYGDLGEEQRQHLAFSTLHVFSRVAQMYEIPELLITLQDLAFQELAPNKYARVVERSGKHLSAFEKAQRVAGARAIFSSVLGIPQDQLDIRENRDKGKLAIGQKEQTSLVQDDFGLLIVIGKEQARGLLGADVGSGSETFEALERRLEIISGFETVYIVNHYDAGQHRPDSPEYRAVVACYWVPAWNDFLEVRIVFGEEDYYKKLGGHTAFKFDQQGLSRRGMPSDSLGVVAQTKLAQTLNQARVLPEMAEFQLIGAELRASTSSFVILQTAHATHADYYRRGDSPEGTLEQFVDSFWPTTSRTYAGIHIERYERVGVEYEITRYRYRTDKGNFVWEKETDGDWRPSDPIPLQDLDRITVLEEFGGQYTRYLTTRDVLQMIAEAPDDVSLVNLVLPFVRRRYPFITAVDLLQWRRELTEINGLIRQSWQVTMMGESEHEIRLRAEERYLGLTREVSAKALRVEILEQNLVGSKAKGRRQSIRKALRSLQNEVILNTYVLRVLVIENQESDGRLFEALFPGQGSDDNLRNFVADGLEKLGYTIEATSLRSQTP